MNGFYKIKTPYSTYNIVVNNNNIYLGGERYVCVQVSAKELYVDSDANCHINSNFPVDIKKGTDMIRALLFFLKNEYPHLCTIKLIDTSSNPTCGSLSSYYIAFNSDHTTWYEHDFKAYLEDSDIMKAYEKRKTLFFSQSEKENNSDIVGFLLRDKLNQQDANNIIKIYNTSSTYDDFFKSIKKAYDNNHCPVIKPWLHNFIKDIMQFKFIYGQEWIITCENNPLTNYNCEITNLATDPFPKFKGRYMEVKRKTFYEKELSGGGKELKKLSNMEREAFKNPHWIGWQKYDIYDFQDKDRRYLKKLQLTHN